MLVTGDTNTRYTRAADTIAAFAGQNGLTDTWVRQERGGVAPAPGNTTLLCDQSAVTDSCEVVDKVLYRGSRLVTLDATDHHNEHAAFLNAAGQMLSDHDPVSARFNWTLNPAYRLSEQFGGPHGDYYNDIGRVAPGARATTVSLRSGSRVDQVGRTLADGTTTSDCVTLSAPDRRPSARSAGPLRAGGPADRAPWTGRYCGRTIRREAPSTWPRTPPNRVPEHVRPCSS